MTHIAERFSFSESSVEAQPRLRVWSGKATSINAEGDNESAFSKASKRGSIAGLVEMGWVTNPENFDAAYRMLIRRAGDKKKVFWFSSQEEEGRPYYVIFDGERFTGCFGDSHYFWDSKEDRVVFTD